MLGELHDVGDYKNTNHDVGAIMWYLKVPKRALKAKKCVFFYIVAKKMVVVPSNATSFL